MAFIRDYAAAGDPGRRHRHHGFGIRGLSHRFRRFHLPGAFGGLARFGAGLIPGGQTALSLYDRFAGGGSGDPGPRPSHTPHGRTHPKHKGTHKKGGGLSGFLAKAGKALSGIDVGQLGEAAIGSIPVVGGVAQNLTQQLAGGGAPDVPDLSGPGGEPPPPVPGHSLVATPDGGAAYVPHGVKHRMPTLVHRRVDSWMRKPGRSMRVTNVHALRRCIRRVEGFQRLVHSVERAYPRMRHAHAAPRHHRIGKRKR